MEPARPGSPVSKFLERNPGGGIHHFCLAVDSVDGWRGSLRRRTCACWATANWQKNVHVNASLLCIPDFLGALVELEEHHD